MRSAPCAQDVEPCANETADRIATGIVTVVALLALGLVAWQAWQSFLHWHDFVVFGVAYVITGLGITVGFHRHFTHRAFATSRPLRAVLAVMGTAAIEGPIVAWVADHRKHHAFSDQVGDPHSPHVEHGGGLRGALRGLAHAHVGWLFLHTQRANKRRYAPDLLDDPLIRFIDRTTLLSRATCGGWHCRPSARRGTTTTTPSPPRLSTACAATSGCSIPAL